ncbi:MAG: hypothetical protein IPJ32_04595 [Sphingobacteriaceae bacterium]|nr:hypothetical protein [Sphingobacteriaceae bacterium]
MARDHIKEIKELKTREEFDKFWAITQKLGKIKLSIESISSLQDDARLEVSKYIPVALVATIESIVRSTIKKMIDADDTYLEKSKQLFESNSPKINFDILVHLKKREFTIGELISHQIPFSKFTHITGAFNTMLGTELFTALTNYTTDDFYLGKKSNAEEFVKNSDQIKKDIISLYEKEILFAMKPPMIYLFQKMNF